MEPRKKLNELAATVICGNDISSSCLCVSALAIIYAGQYAWIALLIVAGVLFLFRKIYGEVVGALPLNGGAYNALLNTTSKSTASLAATLTLISYMATAVLSGNEAMHYIHSIWEALPVTAATIGLLAFFMGLTIIGIGESSKVAIFHFHYAPRVTYYISFVLRYSYFGKRIWGTFTKLCYPGRGWISTGNIFRFCRCHAGYIRI